MSPSRKSSFPRYGGGACLIAILALSVTRLVLAQDAKAEPLPEGVRHVPSDAWFFVNWRVGDILKTPMGKALWQHVSAEKFITDKLTALEEWTGISLRDVDSVTLFVLEPPAMRQPVTQKAVPDMHKHDKKGDFFPPPFKDKPFRPGDFSTQPLEKAPPQPKREQERKPAANLQPIAFQEAQFEMHDHDLIDHPRAEPLVIVSTTKPLDRKKLLQALQGDDGPQRIEAGFLFLSKYSLLIGSARALVHYADRAAAPQDAAAKGMPSLKDALELARPGGKGGADKPGVLLVAAGVRSSPALKHLMFGEGLHMDRQRSSLMASLYPLFNISSGGVTVHLGDELTYTLHLHGKTERSVTLAVEAAKTALTFAELSIDKVLTVKDKELEESAQYLRLVRDALANASVDAIAIGPDGARAQLRLTLKADEKALLMGLAAMVKSTRAAGARTHSMNNLKQIALAMHMYHDIHRALPPPAWSPKKDSKPLLSWRVAMLPYIEQEGLYRQFRHDEPWDSPHNKKLIELMPPTYELPGMKGKPGMTHYQVFTGPHAMFEQKPNATVANISLVQIVDGTSNTLMAAEGKESVIWTKPDDLVYDPKGPLPKLGVFPNGFNAAFGDGTVRFIPYKTPEATLRALITRDGGEAVPFDF